MNQNKDRVAPFTAVPSPSFRVVTWRRIAFVCIAVMAMQVGAAPPPVAPPTPAVAAPVPVAPPATPASVPDTVQQRLLACTGCHGNEGRAASDGFYPRIAGKPEGYLYNQLLNFREGRRHFQLMSYMVDYQSDDYLREMAQYFSSQHPPYAAPQKFDVSKATLEQGETLVKSGDPTHKIPACSACHGEALSGVNPAIPGLLGLPRDYIIAQLGSWKSGARRAAAPDCMAQIAEHLSEQQVGAIAAWIGSQVADSQARPADHVAEPMPARCGSMPSADVAH